MDNMEWFKTQSLEDKIKDYGEINFSIGQEKIDSEHIQDMIILKNKMLEIILEELYK